MKPRNIAQAILILITVIIMMAIFTSCTPLRKTVTKVQTEDTKREKVDSAARTQTVTTRKVDTTLNLPGSTVSGSKPMDNLINGDSLVSENDQARVAVRFNPGTGNIEATATVKPREVPVQVDERIEQQADIRVKRDIEQEQSTSQMERVKEPDSTPLWAWSLILLLLIGLAFCIEYVRRRVKP
jgi:hypothetical protein